MSYTLRSGLRSGRIDDPDHGEIVISDGEAEVDDEAAAAALVERHNTLHWPEDADPGLGTHESDGDASDDGDAGEADSDDGSDDGGDFDLDAFLDREYEDRAEAVADGEHDEHLGAIESAERSKHVLDAVESRQNELEG